LMLIILALIDGPVLLFGVAILFRCGSRHPLGDFFNDSENQNRYSTMDKLSLVDIHNVAYGVVDYK
jgi:hypothetical protein